MLLFDSMASLGRCSKCTRLKEQFDILAFPSCHVFVKLICNALQQPVSVTGLFPVWKTGNSTLQLTTDISPNVNRCQHLGECEEPLQQLQIILLCIFVYL